MKISELIELLETIKMNAGDLPVVVQCRDSGGDYKERDAEIYLFLDTESNELVL